MKLIYTYSALACLSFLIILNSCIPKKDIKPRVGTYYFYPSSSSIGDITVTINGLAITYPSYTSSYSCSSSSITKFSLAPGTYTYSASNSLGTYSWSGSIYVYENQCNSEYLSTSNATSIGSSGGGSGSGVSSGTITDATGLKIELKWTVSPYSSYPVSYADFDMKVYTSSYSSYDTQSNSSTFETSYLPSTGSTSSSLSSGYYYVAVNPYSITSGYSAQYYIVVTGRSSGTSYTFNSTNSYSSYSSYIGSYSYFLQIYKSGNSYTVSKY